MTLFRAVIKKIIGKLYKRKPVPAKPRSWRLQLLDLMPKNSVCAEIGVWKGDYSQKILYFIRPKELHLIDPYLYQTGYGIRPYGGGEAKSQQDMDDLYNLTVARFTNMPQVIFHRDLSENAAQDFPDEYFDWVYIDGHHYYEFVLKDLEKYYPKVKKGGYLTGDDYDWTSEELNGDMAIQRALWDFINSKPGAFESIQILGSQFLIRKKSS